MHSHSTLVGQYIKKGERNYVGPLNVDADAQVFSYHSLYLSDSRFDAASAASGLGLTIKE